MFGALLNGGELHLLDLSKASGPAPRLVATGADHNQHNERIDAQVTLPLPWRTRRLPGSAATISRR